MEGVTFVAIFGGSLFFTCSDRERGRNAEKMDQKNQTEGELQTQPLCVCACVYVYVHVSCWQEWTNQGRGRHFGLLRFAEASQSQMITSSSVNFYRQSSIKNIFTVL